jgi:hypothetical protein
MVGSIARAGALSGVSAKIGLFLIRWSSPGLELPHRGAGRVACRKNPLTVSRRRT